MVLLILEDNETQACALKNIINEYRPDWFIMTAYTYEQANKICMKNTFDLFILDIKLDEDGGRAGRHQQMQDHRQESDLHRQGGHGQGDEGCGDGQIRQEDAESRHGLHADL